MRLSVFIFVLLLAVLGSPTASAAIEVHRSCEADSDCEAGHLCVGDAGGGSSNCVLEETACAVSADCASDWICSHHSSTCPPTGSRCETVHWGVCFPPPEEPCQADAECAEDALCWVVSAPLCAEGDLLCLRAGRTGCVPWGPLCDPETRHGCTHLTCHEGRCVSDGYEKAADTVLVDADKEARLRPLWEQGRCETLPETCPKNGCDAGGTSRESLAGLLLLLGFFLTRRRG